MQRKLLAVPASLIVLSLMLFAVTPRFWENFSQEELLEGTLTRVSLSWDGKLSLAPSYDLYYDTGEPFVFAMVRDRSGNIYLGTGHSGRIFKIDAQGNGSMYFQSKELDVFALALDSAGVLYAGTSPDGKVYRITGPDKATEFCDPGDKYIWSLLFDDQNNLYVGTGGRSLILRVNPKGEKSTFFDPDDGNVVSLARAADGKLLAGTSPNGLVLQIDAQGKAFALLDSALEEIRALATDRFETVYAVAASAKGVETQTPARSDLPAIPPSGPLPISTIQALSAAAEKPKDTRTSVSVPGGEQDSAGNRSAIYAIAKDGGTETIYVSKDRMVYDILIHSDDALLAATGDKGRILSIAPEKHVTVITDSPEEQITRLLKDANTVWAAGSNQGRVYKLGAQLADSGSYESKPLDAKAVAAWGRVSWRFSGGAGESVELQTRSGNTEKPDRTWSDWSPPYRNPGGQQINTPPARYLQWKADFTRGAAASAVSAGGQLEKVALAFLQQNLRPQVVGITLLTPGIALQPTPPMTSGTLGVSMSASGREGPALNSPRSRGRDDQKLLPRQVVQPGAQAFTWKAADVNGDDLVYLIYFRGLEERDWKLLEKKVTDTFYTLNGSALPDGVYLLKVVASDAPSNEFGKALIGELVSIPFVISNSTPLVEVTGHQVEGRKVSVEFRARVAAGRIESAEFSIDGGEWLLVFPDDGVADSAEEHYKFLTMELAAGEHLIGVRAGDVGGNTGTAKIVIRIP